MDAAALILGEVKGDDALAGLNFGDLGPEDHLHAAGRFEKGEDFDAEGREDQVGVLAAADGNTDAEPGQGKRDHGPERVRQGRVFVAVEADGEQDDGGDAENSSADPEGDSLSRAGEAELLVRFGDGHRGGVFAGRLWMGRAFFCLFISRVIGYQPRYVPSAFQVDSFPSHHCCDHPFLFW